MQREIYLDHAATTLVFPQVVEAMTQAMLGAYGNPSSLHRKGIEAESILKETRSLISKRLGVSAGEIVFTSGGTEGNALAIKGRGQGPSAAGEASHYERNRAFVGPQRMPGPGVRRVHGDLPSR